MRKGFGYIEMLAILAIAVLIGVMAIPKRTADDSMTAVDNSTRANDIVRTAHASAIAALKRFPSVKELAGFVDNAGASAQPDGIVLSLDQSRLTVQTYSDAACTRPTTQVDETVACLNAP